MTERYEEQLDQELAGETAPEFYDEVERSTALLNAAGHLLLGAAVALFAVRLYYVIDGGISASRTAELVSFGVLGGGIALVRTQRARAWGLRLGALALGLGLGLGAGVWMAQPPPVSALKLEPHALSVLEISLPAGRQEVAVDTEASGKISRKFEYGGRRGGVVLEWNRAPAQDDRTEIERLGRAIFAAMGSASQESWLTTNTYQGIQAVVQFRAPKQGYVAMALVQCTNSEIQLGVVTAYRASPAHVLAIHERVMSSLRCRPGTAGGATARIIPRLEVPSRFGRVVEDGSPMLVSWRGEVLVFGANVADDGVDSEQASRLILKILSAEPSMELHDLTPPVAMHRSQVGARYSLLSTKATVDGDAYDLHLVMLDCMADKVRYLVQYLVPEGSASPADALALFATLGCPDPESPRIDSIAPLAEAMRSECDAGLEQACAELEALEQELTQGDGEQEIDREAAPTLTSP